MLIVDYGDCVAEQISRLTGIINRLINRLINRHTISRKQDDYVLMYYNRSVYIYILLKD